MRIPKSNYVTHLEAEIEWLRKANAVLQGKLDRMEIALTSTATPQGAAYAKLSQPIPLAPNQIPLANPDSWITLQEVHEKELRALEEKETLRAASKEPS